MLIEDIVVAISGNVVLEQPEAVPVYRADEHRAEAVEEGLAHSLADSPDYPFLQFSRRPFSESEGDDRRGLGALGDQRCYAARDRLRLARAGTGDNLQVASAMGNDLLLFR